MEIVLLLAIPLIGAILLAVFGARRWAPEANVVVSLATFIAACALTARVISAGTLTAAGAQFFSSNISGAQRLANGNTLITEGAGGRVFEVTSDRQIVWEWMNAPAAGARTPGTVYRAYRIPYTWLAQLPRPQEKAVTPPPNAEFRVP